MLRLSAILKSLTIILFLIPPLLFLVGFDVYPGNISKFTLLIIAEIFAAAVLLMTVIYKKNILQLLSKKLFRFVLICLSGFLLLVLGFAFFSVSFISGTSGGEKVLLPLRCNEPLCTLMKIAKENNEEIGVRLGKDRLIDIINLSNKKEVLVSEIIYDLFIVILFSGIIFFFYVLSVFYEKQLKHTDGKELIQLSLTSNYEVYTTTYHQKQDPWNHHNFKFNIFLSYASAQKDDAELIYHALLNNQHMVFLDRKSLPRSMEYNKAIYTAINCSDIMIFLISPESVATGRYTLSELKFAQERWPNANGNLMPVMTLETPYKDIPAYAKSVSVFKPAGNLTAELIVEIEKIYNARKNATLPSV